MIKQIIYSTGISIIFFIGVYMGTLYPKKDVSNDRFIQELEGRLKPPFYITENDSVITIHLLNNNSKEIPASFYFSNCHLILDTIAGRKEIAIMGE